MSIFEAARDRISDTARAAAKASRDLVEVSKLNAAIKTEEDKIKVLMLEIGKTVFETYKEERPVEPGLNLKCDEILTCEKNIEELKQKVLEVKNLRQCPGCATRVDRSYMYCPNCGAKLE